MVYVAESLKTVFSEQSLFDEVDSLEGEIYRDVSGRRTFRVEIGDNAYFAKVHYGVGWWEIFKNLLQFRWPILGAESEWQAIKKLRSLGVDTLNAVAFVSQGRNPAQIKSCIVTEAIDGTLSLEELVLAGQLDLNLKRQLVTRLASISKILHQNGVNHRDYYLCHFLLSRDALTTGKIERLHLIDLHRVQIRASGVPRRWLEKDLAGLLFSAADAGLTRRDVLRFIRLYTGDSLRQTLARDREFWLRVLTKATRLYLKDQGRESAFLKQLAKYQ